MSELSAVGFECKSLSENSGKGDIGGPSVDDGRPASCTGRAIAGVPSGCGGARSGAGRRLQPGSNTGLQNTCGTEARVHWLSVTMRVADYDTARATLMRVCRVLGSDGEEGRRSLGYRGWGCGLNGFAAMKEDLEPGKGYWLWVNLPGACMDWLWDVMGLDGPLVIWMLYRLGFRAKRVDVALDSYDARVSPLTVFKHWCRHRGSCVSHAREAEWKQSGVTGGEKAELSGDLATCKIGSRWSERMLRVYDKGGERYAALPPDSTEPFEHCTRFELECKDGAADAVCGELIVGGLKAIPGVLCGYCDFLRPDGRDSKDKNKSRRKERVAWWRRIIEAAERVVLHLKRDRSKPEKALQYMKQLAVIIALAKSCGVWGEVLEKVREAKLPVGRLLEWRWAFGTGQGSLAFEAG